MDGYYLGTMDISSQVTNLIPNTYLKVSKYGNVISVYFSTESVDVNIPANKGVAVSTDLPIAKSYEACYGMLATSGTTGYLSTNISYSHHNQTLILWSATNVTTGSVAVLSYTYVTE
jgi:hypothetical protein